ncbi:MAG: YwiC-like family protein [Chloroflexi bacterium]|nr:YwiC-like family protein [Chloroflexota bacterium]
MPVAPLRASDANASAQSNGVKAKANHTMSPGKFFKIYVLPPEHGGWFLLLGPFLFGALAAAQPNADLIVLFLFALASYIARQPLTIFVKALSGRRAKSDARPARWALGAVGMIAALLLLVLILRGYAFLLWLGIPAGLVVAWQLWLVTQREERQIGIELIGAGTLALSAPAAYWGSIGAMTPTGWWLWGLAWLYAASSIVYVYLRLTQRKDKERKEMRELLRDGRRTLLYAGTSVGLTVALALLQFVPPFTPLPFTLALLHYLYGITHPCVGAKPLHIGAEQSLATSVFYLVLGIVFSNSRDLTGF